MRIPMIIILAVVSMLLGLSEAFAETKVYSKPKVDGYRVDWCYKWAVQCGEFAADRFCKSKGFDESKDFSQAPGIGLSTPTKLLGSGQICEEDFCSGFKHITCQRDDPIDEEDDEDEEDAPPKAKFYDKPSVNGMRVSACLTKDNLCQGKAAAKAFCKKKGFDKVKSFGTSQPLTQFIPTMYIGNGKKCKEPFCIAIKNLTCVEF